MHDYSIDRHPKEKILFALAFFAITAAPLINDGISALIVQLNQAGIFRASVITAIPVFLVFSAIYFAFDRVLWKVAILRKVLLVPDLNGRWTCTGRTTLQGGQPANLDWNAEITITQSWSRILIHLRTQQSESKSIAASIFHESGVGYRVLYQYTNRPGADQLELRDHSGAAELRFDEACIAGEGYYFTDRHRSTVGTTKLRRI
jgi:hypothetical protein